MCSALRSQNVSDPLQVEYSKLVVNSHMVPGKIQVMCKSHLSSPQICSVLYFEIGSFCLVLATLEMGMCGAG